MIKPSVYLAGPILGTSYEECTDWRDDVRKELELDIDCFSPMRSKSYLRKETNLKDGYEDTLFSSQRGIFARDMSDCRRSDAIFVNLLGAKIPSIGSIMEITAFWWQQKPIVLVMEDGNINDHAMIREACPFRVQNLWDGIYAIRTILLPVDH